MKNNTMIPYNPKKDLETNYYNKTEVELLVAGGSGSGGSIDLSNYYKKLETYSKAQVDALVAGGGADLSDYYTKAEVKSLISAIPATDLTNYYDKTQVDSLIPNISTKQDTLVSATNIKTINGQSVLGGGDLVISGGGAVDLTDYYDKTETETLLSNKVDKVTGKGLSTNDFTDTFKQALDGHLASTSNPHNVTALQVGAYSKSENDNLLDKKANLDLNNKIPLSEIPDSILGQLKYMGVWDFSSGFPTVAQKGNYWITSVSGNGYEVGDWAVYNGTSFDKVDNTDAVSSVAGRTGNVVLNKNDVGLNNVDNTSDLNKPISTATQTALNNYILLTEKGSASGVAPLDAAGKIDSSYLPVFTSDVTSVNGQTGVVTIPVPDVNTTIQGNTFNGVNQLVKLDATGKLPAIDGSQLTGIISSVTSVNGYTGTVILTKSDIGLANVDNTSDLNKPISTATQTALNGKQDNLVSGTSIKTINGQSVLGSGDIVITSEEVDLTDYYDKTETETLLSNKVDKVTGKGLSTNDFTDTFKQALELKKVQGISTDSVTKKLVVNYTDSTVANLNINDIITDVHVSGATLDATTNVLTLTSDDGGADVTVDLSDFVNSGELTSALSGKADKIHSHSTSDITGLDATLSNKVTKNEAIIGDTKTKITYDSNGLVINGADLSTSDIPNLPQSKIVNLETNLSNKIDKGVGVVGATKTKVTYNNDGIITGGADLDEADLPNIPQSKITNLVSDLNNKQSSLISGTNIKTINGQSVLGSGDIVITGGGAGITKAEVDAKINAKHSTAFLMAYSN